MRQLFRPSTILAAALWAAFSSPAQATIFSCSESNDLYNAVGGTRVNSPEEAVTRAAPNEPVLILADSYPQSPTPLTDSFWQTAKSKNLRLYVEYPSNVPGLTFGDPRTTTWERQVITSDTFAPALKPLSILHAHACRYLPTKTDLPTLITSARVAGYDHAVYGLPAETSPILLSANSNQWLIATTKLSSFKSARYAPQRDWVTLWQHILTTLGVKSDPQKLAANPLVHPAFPKSQPLLRNAQLDTVTHFANWILNSDLLLTKERHADVTKQLLEGKELIDRPSPGAPQADGSYGILEGYTSLIDPSGHQQQRLPLRADCTAESAMVLALDYSLRKHAPSKSTATNLLNFLYKTSGMCQGERGDPKSPAYGLIAWGDVAPAWLVANYGDDNARTLLATLIAAHSLNDPQWNDALLRGIHANFLTTGKLGFRGDRIDMPSLMSQGRDHFHNASPVNPAPHFEAYLWACYLWSHAHAPTQSSPSPSPGTPGEGRGEGSPPLLGTGNLELGTKLGTRNSELGTSDYLSRTKTAIRMTMQAYPDNWRWGDNIERAHMLLPLAWLVRIEDTPEHRAWLDKIATDLLASQVDCGAIRERLRGAGAGHYNIPQSNEAYGTGETPLIQSNSDPASDQLYTNGFALLALHEAAAATNDPKLKAAEDKLADYLCRIQTRASTTTHPYLNGTWFRAFDFDRWDYFASSADLGWGAWSLEAGWAQSWTATTLALRHKNTTLWDLTLPKTNPAASD